VRGIGPAPITAPSEALGVIGFMNAAFGLRLTFALTGFLLAVFLLAVFLVAAFFFVAMSFLS
jgi:hypothetical protein